MPSWYFAYGSNLLKEQMIARVGGIGPPENPPRIAYLSNHRLVFDQLSPTSPAYANIRSPGTGVWGVIYSLGEPELKIMDGFEGGYDRKSVFVTDKQGRIVNATTYVMKQVRTLKSGNPSQEYLDKILTGAKQHGLDESYIKTIVATAKVTP